MLVQIVVGRFLILGLAMKFSFFSDLTNPSPANMCLLEKLVKFNQLQMMSC